MRMQFRKGRKIYSTSTEIYKHWKMKPLQLIWDKNCYLTFFHPPCRKGVRRRLPLKCPKLLQKLPLPWLECKYCECKPLCPKWLNSQYTGILEKVKVWISWMLRMFVNKLLCANMHTLTLGSWVPEKEPHFTTTPKPAKKNYLMSISAS